MCDNYTFFRLFCISKFCDLPSKKNTTNKPVASTKINGATPQEISPLTHNGNHKNGVAKAKPSAKKPVSPAKKTVPAKKATAKKKADIAPSPKKQTAKKTVVVKPELNDAVMVTFRIRFHTTFGQQLKIIGNVPALGNDDLSAAVVLEYLDQHHWQVQMEIPRTEMSGLRYHYLLEQTDGSIDHDWGVKSLTVSPTAANELMVIDSWNHAGYYENVFYTEPFRSVLLEKVSYQSKQKPKKLTHRFIAKAPLLQPGQALCLIGSGKALHNWNTATPLVMNKEAASDEWIADVDLSQHDYVVEYKYGVYDTKEQQFIRFENGENRFAPAAVNGQQVLINDGFAILPNTHWKGAGIAIPVFSLRTENSFGVGEFNDLKLLVDWAKATGFKMVQILPVNDTSATHTWKDSYPYAAISAFALHPMFLNLAEMTEEKNKKMLQDIEALRQSLNASATVDYDAVVEAKWNYIRKIYPLQKAATFKSADFKKYFRENEHWLVPYAVFCYLRDQYGTSDFNQWPAYQQYNEQEIAALAKDGDASSDEINIHFFVQYHLHLQLKAATEYAHANHVIVKGDIPIGVYRFGADAWQQPQLYHLEVQAGAPPDDFAVKGQNWSFPTYNWERMRQDGFRWWNQRFEQMSYYFDAFRIDHILGFFRIWSIPLHAVEGIMGRFVPAVPVHVNEFNERGIRFDFLRYARPFITDAVLQEVFGSKADEVKANYVRYDGFDHYVMDDAFDTQRKVEIYFAAHPEADQSLKEGLFDLISNVILFEEEGSNGTRFHFRFGMEGTISFRYLDEHTRHQLKQLYVNYFFERQDHHWEIEAMQKLPGLKRATNMLVCGEDLGLVPHCVPNVMKQLGILSLEIQRMPKAVQKQFFHPADAPYLSVVTPSTHDMSTVRSWWEEDRTATQQFYNNELRQPGDAPYFCEPWISKAIILQHMYSPAMWSIFQVQDLLGMSAELRRENPAEERINLPANPQHYWNYRMHLTIEQLLKSDEFNTELKEYLLSSGRA